jgi:hypothetical protein
MIDVILKRFEEPDEVRVMVKGRFPRAAFDDGRVIPLHAGELFHIPADPHDSWVIGHESCVSLHFLGADRDAR